VVTNATKYPDLEILISIFIQLYLAKLQRLVLQHGVFVVDGWQVMDVT
jgi:hypothetical protein